MCVCGGERERERERERGGGENGHPGNCFLNQNRNSLQITLLNCYRRV